MKKILFMSLLLMLTLLQQVTAQNRNVSGRVTDRQSGEGLPGVTVLLKGTTNGVSTNSDGTYTLSVPSAGGTLVFSSIGYTQTERPIGTEDQVNIGLAADSKQLSEVVVTGYGSVQERRDLTGSVATVQGAAIAQLATPSFDQQLGGRAAGVQVTVPSAVLGQAPRIRIRGTNSISSGASPLIVIDGVPVITGNQSGVTQNNPLGDINPADIESYEVLKDGSSTAIYGSRAANGVILITTKKGKAGRASVTYDAYVGTSEVTKRYEVLNANDFITISNEKFGNRGDAAVAFPYRDANGNEVSTDWQDEIYRRGFQQNHAVTLSGGTDKSTYYFSLGWTRQQSPIKANDLERYTFRTNLDQQVTNWLKVGTSVGLTRNKNNGLNTANNGLSGNVTSALQLFPNVPVRNDDGTFYISNRNTLGQGNNRLPIDFNYVNTVFVLENNKLRATNYRALGNAYAEATVIPGLRLRTQIGIDGYFLDDFLFYDPRHGDGGAAVGGRIIQNYSPVVRWNWQNTANFDRTIGEDHKFGVVVGTEFQQQTSSYFGANVNSLSDRFFGQNNIISGTFATPQITGDYSQNGFDSYFGRVNYSFKDRYLASVSVRRDAISALPEATRRGTFAGGSLGWRVSEEGFFKGISALSFISDLKFRGSYAEVGNVDLGSDFPYVGYYGPAQYGSQNGISYQQAGNNNLKWETSKKTDVGVDIAFIDGRIGLTVDLYKNDVDGLILREPTPLSLGVPNNYITKNVGAIENKGLEFALNTQNIVKEDFTWSTNFNLAFNKNEVKDLGIGGDLFFPYTIVRVGEPISSIFGFDFVGVNSANGNPIWRKANGTLVQGNVDNTQYYTYDENNPTSLATPSTLVAADKKVLGNANPTYFGGFENTFTYKGLDLSFLIRFSGGNKIMNVSRQQLLRQDFVNNGTEILDRWTTAGQVTDVPKLRAGTGDFVNNAQNSVSRFVEKGDFIRGQNLSIGYTFGRSMVERFKLGKVRVYAQGQNLFIITKYSGVDPEAQNSPTSSTQFGVDYFQNPQQRVFTLGLNVGF